MKLSLPAQTQRQITRRVRSGRYKSPEDVVAAAISQLDQREELGDFSPDELDRLLAGGEKSGKPLEGERVFAELRGLRRSRHRKAG